MIQTRLLVDADILVYSAAAMNELSVSFLGDEDANLEPVKESDINNIKTAIGQVLEDYEDRFKGDLTICLSDWRRKYFRHTILPTYKHNRAGIVTPMWLKECKEWIAKTYNSKYLPGLEADDVMGILATRPNSHYTRNIIVSEDKDMLQIPGEVFQPKKNKLHKVSKEEGERWHIIQTLIGDSTDGYSGCPGVGPVAAEKILDSPRRLLSSRYVFKRGNRKGQSEVRWTNEDTPCTVWEAIVSNFERRDLTEADALQQARVAKILTNDEYDVSSRTVTLWSPEGHPKETLTIE